MTYQKASIAGKATDCHAAMVRGNHAALRLCGHPHRIHHRPACVAPQRPLRRRGGGQAFSLVCGLVWPFALHWSIRYAQALRSTARSQLRPSMTRHPLHSRQSRWQADLCASTPRSLLRSGPRSQPRIRAVRPMRLCGTGLRPMTSFSQYRAGHHERCRPASERPRRERQAE